MKSASRTCRRHSRAGFTLAAVLVIVGALLVLAVGILLVSTIERGTARLMSDRERARLAARAGLEEVRVLLGREMADDGFVVLQSTRAEPFTGNREPAPYLFLTRGTGEVVGRRHVHRYVPLFSAAGRPENTVFAAPQVDPLLPATTGERVDFHALPHLDSARVAWVPVRDEQGRIIARYAYWMEDLQGRVDPAVAGNEKGADGSHDRASWPFPAPGLNDGPDGAGGHALDQIALFAVDPDARDDAQRNFGKTLIANRRLLVSPDAPLAAAGIQPPLERLTEPSADGGFVGDLADPVARAAERGLGSGLCSYREQALVPHAEGISTTSAGMPKLNLNELLAKDRATAIDQMAAHIRSALPDFDQRKGGFPDDYVKTLAANALDYADEDNDPSVGAGYRGIDGFPLVSEFVFRSTWENVRIQDGRKFLELSTTVYVELWNMNHVAVSGRAQVSYENRYTFRIAPNPNDISLDDLTHATHNLVESDGRHWFPAFQVDLQPNEYRVYKCGTVFYTFDAVSAADPEEWIASPLILGGETHAAQGSGYRMRWNGVMVDQSRGGVHRNDSFLRHPSAAKEGRHVNRLTVPGHSYSRGGGFINNMGDVRMSHYLAAPQDANSYPQNYSPNRRTIREGSIYTNESRHNLVYGRVLPSEWPDGGHDSPFGTPDMFGLFGTTRTGFTDDHRIEPDDSRFFSQLPDLSRGREEAPTRLSNSGRFLSVSELGRTYDPVMWRVRPTTTAANSNPPGASWGDVLVSSVSSSDHGGGNTLRIGRPEHARFDVAGQRASHVLDLFHSGLSRSTERAEREGPLAHIEGHVNLNTASKPALRMIIAGRIRQDPALRRFVGDSHTQGVNRFPSVEDVSPEPDYTLVADRIADAIIRSRPYAGTGELANARGFDGAVFTHVFGNPGLFAEYPGNGYPKLQWTDSAAEEVFARVHEASTVRSRNFRVWVIGQAVAPTAAMTDRSEVLSEVRRAFTVFADPGERNADGSIDPTKSRLKVIHENDF
jgi:hypothetical protein